jgi:hypothetical protein
VAILNTVTRPHSPLRAGALRLSRAAVLAALFVLAWQLGWRLPGFAVAAIADRYLGRTISLAEVLAVIATLSFVLASPLTSFRLRGAPGAFAGAALVLAGLATASSSWALYPWLAVVQGAHLMIWAAFAVVVAGARVPPRHMTAAFVIGLLVHAVVGFAQAITQAHVGLTVLGELPIRPEAPWSRVPEDTSPSILRVYGLSSHPNVLAGHLAIGLILCWGLASDRRRRMVAAAWAALFVCLLLTFSRAGVLAAFLGMAVAVLWMRRAGSLPRPIARLGRRLVITTVVMIAVFAWALPRYLADRIPSIHSPLGSRRGLMDAAVRLIAGHPLGGVGAGNSRAADLTVPDYVHNIPLLIGVELGLTGLAVAGTMVAVLVAVGYRRWRARSVHRWHGLVAGSLTGVALVSLLDHYLWSVPQGGLLGAWLCGWWLTDDPPDSLDEDGKPAASP